MFDSNLTTHKLTFKVHLNNLSFLMSRTRSYASVTELTRCLSTCLEAAMAVLRPIECRLSTSYSGRGFANQRSHAF